MSMCRSRVWTSHDCFGNAFEGNEDPAVLVFDLGVVHDREEKPMAPEAGVDGGTINRLAQRRAGR
jgi:hypothetical protein